MKPPIITPYLLNRAYHTGDASQIQRWTRQGAVFPNWTVSYIGGPINHTARALFVGSAPQRRHLYDQFYANYKGGTYDFRNFLAELDMRTVRLSNQRKSIDLDYLSLLFFDSNLFNCHPECYVDIRQELQRILELFLQTQPPPNSSRHVAPELKRREHVMILLMQTKLVNMFELLQEIMQRPTFAKTPLVLSRGLFLFQSIRHNVPVELVTAFLQQVDKVNPQELISVLRQYMPHYTVNTQLFNVLADIGERNNFGFHQIISELQSKPTK